MTSTPAFSVPTRLRISEEQRRMLDELEVFWNTDTSSIIRRAILTEHALLQVAKTREPGRYVDFAHKHQDEFDEQYHARIAELAELRRTMMGDDSPLLVR